MPVCMAIGQCSTVATLKQEFVNIHLRAWLHGISESFYSNISNGGVLQETVDGERKVCHDSNTLRHS